MEEYTPIWRNLEVRVEDGRRQVGLGKLLLYADDVVAAEVRLENGSRRVDKGKLLLYADDIVVATKEPADVRIVWTGRPVKTDSRVVTYQKAETRNIAFLGEKLESA